MKHLMRMSLMVSTLLATSGAFAIDSEIRDGQPNFLHPRNGSSISEYDQVSVLYTDGCGANELDPTVLPVFLQRGNRFVVEVTVRSTTLPFCLAAPPPPKAWVVPLGRLPKGDHLIERRVFELSANNVDRRLVSLLLNTVHVGETPHASVSGTWSVPSAPGRGYVVNVIPSPQLTEPQVMVFSATEDAANRPVWLLGLSHFVDADLNVEVTLGGMVGPAQSLRFAYRGCGRLAVTDLAFPTITYDLQQVTTVAGVEPCEPSGERIAPAR